MEETTPYAQTHQLTKTFGDTTALSDVTLSLPAGHIVGLYLPTRGECRTFGVSSGQLGEEILTRIGYVPQEGDLIPWMKAGQFLRFLSAYYPSWNSSLQERLFDRFEIPRNQRLGIMSPGQRQKVAIIAAVSYEPDLLIMDEPAAALDPMARGEVMEFLLEIIQNSRRTVIISSHILSDIEKVADHVLILKRGRLARDASIDYLRESYIRLEINAGGGQRTWEWLPKDGVLEQKMDAGRAVLCARSSARERLLSAVQRAGATVEVHPLPLEQIYRLVMNEDL